MNSVEERVEAHGDRLAEHAARLTAIETQHQQTLLKILSALESSADGGRVGLQETVRTLSSEVKALTKNVASLMEVVAGHEKERAGVESLMRNVANITEVVSTHERERQQAKGAWWATCLIASVSGAIVGVLIKVFWQ